MGYNGYLVKVGDYTIPTRYIKYESYKVKKNVSDLDSYRDADGVLHRNALSHYSISVSFDLLPLKNSEVESLMSNIRNRYINATEKKVSITAYIPELNEYITQECYLVDPEFTIRKISDTIVYYNEMTLEFIGY